MESFRHVGQGGSLARKATAHADGDHAETANSTRRELASASCGATAIDAARGRVQETRLLVQGRPARVFCGGAGTPILLLHGGWGGARLHWSRIWDALAERHRVIAPDLPGLGAVEQPALPSVPAYVDWLVGLLDAFGVARAVCVGNSFGASLAWSLAGRRPGYCASLVLVDGIPMPRTPRPLRLLGETRVGSGLLRRLLRRWSYSRTAVPLAFADLALVPSELQRLISDEWPLISARFAELLIAGDGPPEPIARPYSCGARPIGCTAPRGGMPGGSRRDSTAPSCALSTGRATSLSSKPPNVSSPSSKPSSLERKERLPLGFRRAAVLAAREWRPYEPRQHDVADGR